MPTSPWPPPSHAPGARGAGPAVGDLRARASRRAQRTRTSVGARAGVLERVGQRLLDDAVGGEVERRPAAGARSPSTVSSTGRPGRARALDQRVELVAASAAARARAASSSACSTPSRRRISASASRPVRSISAAASSARSRVAVEDPPRAAGLHDHHADGVRDDVVHLARDPPALLGDRARGLAPRARSSARDRGLVQLGGQRARGCARRGPASQNDRRRRTVGKTKSPTRQRPAIDADARRSPHDQRSPSAGGARAAVARARRAP